MGLAGKELNFGNIVYVLVFRLHFHLFILDYLKVSPSQFSQKPYSGDKVWRGHVIVTSLAYYFWLPISPLCHCLLCSGMITVAPMAATSHFSSIQWKQIAFLKAFTVSQHCPFIDAPVILVATLGNNHR